MKRFYLICTLLFCLSIVCASSARFSLISSPSAFSGVTNFSDGKISYMVSISRKEDGFKLTMPTSFSINTNNWYIGELKSSGLLSYMVSPTEKALNAYYSKPFQRISQPALVPSLSGIAKSFKYFDFAVFSPVFNPSSPVGAYADYNTRNFYSGLLFLNYREKSATKLLEDWEDIFKSGVNIYWIAGCNSTINRGDFRLDSSSFIQTVYRQTYGLTGMLGCNVEAKYGQFCAGFIKRLSNNKTSDPIESNRFELSVDRITLGYLYQQFGKPSYGGKAQKQSATFTIGYKMPFFNYAISSTITADEDTGMSSSTLYSAQYSRLNTQIEFELEINRSAAQLSVKNFVFSVETDNVKFCVDGAKYSVLLSYNHDFKLKNRIGNLKLSVDQDHKYTLNASLYY